MKLTDPGLFLLAVFLSFNAAGEDLIWGTNAITLDSKNSVSVGPFYQAGGENRPVTPTECRISYNADELLVDFRCAENDMAFPAMGHGVNWYSQLHSAAEQDAAFPDKVDLFVSPDLNKPSYYQFAVTRDGQKFGAKRRAHPPKAPADEELDTANNFE